MNPHVSFLFKAQEKLPTLWQHIPAYRFSPIAQERQNCQKVLLSGRAFTIFGASMERRSGGCQAEAAAAWRAGFQQKYLRQLVAVLREKRIDPATSVLARSRAVKLAADLSLAITARGRNVWSRAILRKYLFRLNKSRCQRRSVLKSRMNSPRSASAKNNRRCITISSSKKFVRRAFGVASRPGTSIRSHGNEEAEDTVASRMQTLRELVPGNRGLDPPVFLKETADYIVALKMQVQAMQALADWYTNQSA